MPTVSQGSLFRRAGTQNWFIKFYIDGKIKRETTGTPDRERALEFLRQRVDEAHHGRFTDIVQRPTFEDMHARLLENYQFKRNRTDPSRHVKQLAAMFAGLRGEEITDERIAAYSRKRLKIDGMTPATLRRELAVLKRMLRLSSHRLPRVPLVDLPRVDNARQGFFDEEELQAILPHLPPHARNLVEFLYLTGWRSSESFRLMWTEVNWKERTVLLKDSKSREPRLFPFKYHPRLELVLQRQRAGVTLGIGEWLSLPGGFPLEGPPAPQASPVMGDGLQARRSPRPLAPRLSPDCGAQPDPRRRAAGDRNEDHRAQDGFDLSPISHRRRGATCAGNGRGRGLPW